jgi:predicted lipid carrier protein YhbT
LQLLLQQLIASVSRRHPGLHERLQSCQGRSIGIVPTDLPFAMVIEPRANAISLRVERGLDLAGVVASIRGPILALLGLVNGSYDGDALFFSRDIAIEGDVELVLALRNAIDDAQLELGEEFAACLGPLAPPLFNAAKGPIAACARLLGLRECIAR